MYPQTTSNFVSYVQTCDWHNSMLNIVSHKKITIIHFLIILGM